MVMTVTDERPEPAYAASALIDDMNKFNEELVRAGVLLGGRGLLPSSLASEWSSQAEDDRRDGPFTESKGADRGLLAWQVSSMEEAIEG